MDKPLFQMVPLWLIFFAAVGAVGTPSSVRLQSCWHRQ